MQYWLIKKLNLFSPLSGNIDNRFIINPDLIKSVKNNVILLLTIKWLYLMLFQINK